MNPFTSPTQNRMIARSVGTVTAAGILSLMAAMPALAADPYFTLKFESTASSSTNGGINGILGEATYTFSEINLGEMTLSLKNLSGSPVTGSRLVSTGFDLPTNPPASANVNFVSFSQIDPNWNIVYPGTAVPPSLPLTSARRFTRRPHPILLTATPAGVPHLDCKTAPARRSERSL